MDGRFTREDVDFYVNGTRCSAWLYLPDARKPCPVIVMAHGLGGVREMRLDSYAETFAGAGYACFLFDYRNLGASDGTRRQRINAREQLTDWNCAIDFVKEDHRLDGNTIFLFGTSFSGGHVITLAAARKDLTAVISQCPYTNTLATLGTLSPLSALKAAPAIIAGLLSCVTGYHPVMFKLAGKRGTAAIMAVPDYEKYLQQVPPRSTFINKTPARTMIEFFKYSPGRYTKDIEIPIFYAVCRKDSLAPAKATAACARRSRNSKINVYDCGHFDIYFGSHFEKAVMDYMDFLDACVRSR